MKEVYYHATFWDNVSDIAESGIKPGDDGFVHLCKYPEDAFEFGYEKALFEDRKRIIVLPIMLNPDSVSEYQGTTVFCIEPINCMKYKGVIDCDRIALTENDFSLFSTHGSSSIGIFSIAEILFHEVLKAKAKSLLQKKKKEVRKI